MQTIFSNQLILILQTYLQILLIILIYLLKLYLMDTTNPDYKLLYQNSAEMFTKYAKTAKDRLGIYIPAIIHQIPEDAQFCADLGCANAYYHPTILEKRPKISKLFGLDFSSNMLQLISPQIKSNPKTQYVLQDLTKPTSLEANYFNCLTSIFTIEYINREQIQSYFRNCYKILKPNGKLVIFSWNINTFIKSPLLQKLMPDNLAIYDKEICQDGGYIQCKFKLGSAKLIHWQDQTLINYLKMAGFQGKVESLREQHIDKTLYSQEEIKIIVDSKVHRLVIGIKNS